MNVSDYLNRIHYHGSLEPTLQTLAQLQSAHMQKVPFENLSIHYKQPIILKEALLYQKIVEQNRGGFCYELNGLFAWLLRELGFRVTKLSAGVVNDRGEFGAEFDHMTLMVHLDEDYLVDVGFGDSFRAPLRFNFRGEQSQNGMSYQIAAEDDAFILSEQNNRDENPRLQPRYRFTLVSHQLAEYEGMCQFHQTSPESSFTKKRVCTIATSNGRYTLSDLRFIVTEDGTRREIFLNSEEEFKNILKEYFNIELSAA